MLSTIDILGSSSKGNAYVLTFDNGTIIQLDAGVKNEHKKDVQKVFLSHNHIDHNKFIKEFNEDIVIKPSEKDRVSPEWFSFNYLHNDLDGNPITTNGYTINIDNEVVVYITDCGDIKSIPYKFPKATILIIECNWDYFGIKYGKIKLEDYGKRVISKGGHLSNFDCLKLIDNMGINKDCKILFVHRSEHHTNEDTYKIFDLLPNKKIIAKKGEKIYAKSWKNI